MKKLILGLALLFAPTLAFAQCNGVFPTNTVCGSLAGGPPGPVAFSTFPTSGTGVPNTWTATQTFTAFPIINLNTTPIASQAPATAGTVLRAVNSDAIGTFVVLDSYGSFGQFLVRRADGSAASPTALQADNPIASFGGRGYGTTGFSTHESGQIAVLATAAWTDTNWPAYINFKTVANGDATTTLKTRMTILDNGNVGIGDTNPQSLLTVSANAAQGLNSIAAATYLIIGADASSPSMATAAYGAANGGFFGISAGGTGASPSATPATTRLMSVGGSGYANGAFTTAKAIVSIDSVSAWTASDNSAQITLQTTPTSSTARAVAETVFASGGVGVGAAATDPGINNMTVTGVYKVGTTAGLTITKTVRASGGAADCNLVFTGGLLTSSTC